MMRSDAMRMMAKVARLYYDRGLNQAAISQMMDVSQATISRLLKRARAENIVRISLSVPRGFYPDLEEALEAGYGLKGAIIADSEDDARVEREIGSVAAYYLETTLGQDEVVGISSWSATLLAMVDQMHRRMRPSEARVLQILGGMGTPEAEEHATLLTRRLAQVIGGVPCLLPAPGVVGSAAAREVFLKDPFVREALARFEQVTLALVGIGDIQPSRMLAASGNVFAPEELKALRDLGAVGDICLHFYDRQGAPVQTELHDRVIGMTLTQLKGVRRSVGVAGGRRKRAAILGALRGGWINVLVTDRLTAEWLARASETLAGRSRSKVMQEIGS
jgi:DNA-binding transcriptional regulator LsrR (DeoR family)